MNGIEKITDRIAADAQEKADAILADAKAQAADIAANFAQRAEKVKGELLAQGRDQAAQREERLLGAAQLEGRKLDLQVKQELLGETFDLALRDLRAMPKEEYISFLARRMAEASSTKAEQVVMNPADRSQVGKEAVTRANELLGEGRLTLSAESRDMTGGFILSAGPVEVNCTLDTLVAQARERMAGEIAQTLFPQ